VTPLDREVHIEVKARLRRGGFKRQDPRRYILRKGVKNESNGRGVRYEGHERGGERRRKTLFSSGTHVL